jgi:hypothetical protein
MNTSPNKPVRGHAPALEVELTKGPDGKLRSFRFSIGTAVVLVLLICLEGGASDRWLPALKWIFELVR